MPDLLGGGTTPENEQEGATLRTPLGYAGKERPIWNPQVTPTCLRVSDSMVAWCSSSISLRAFFFYGPFLTSTTMSASSPVHLKYLRALCAYQVGSFSDSTCSVGILRRIIQVWLWSEGGLPRGYWVECRIWLFFIFFFLFLSFSFLSFFFFSTFLFSKHPSTTRTSIVSRKETRRSCFDAGIDENNIFQEQRQRLGNRDAP